MTITVTGIQVAHHEIMVKLALELANNVRANMKHLANGIILGGVGMFWHIFQDIQDCQTLLIGPSHAK